MEKCPDLTHGVWRSRSRTEEFALMQFCIECGNRFFIRPVDEGTIRTCSKRCDRKIARKSAAKERLAEVEKLSLERIVTPTDIQQLRNRAFQHVVQQLDIAHHFVVQKPLPGQGKPPTLNAQQVAVFRTMLNKVLPDLHHSQVEDASGKRDVKELSRAELEAIVASAKDITPPVIEPDEPSPPPVHTESASTPGEDPPDDDRT